MQTVAPRYVSGESRTRTSTPKGCTRRRGGEPRSAAVIAGERGLCRLQALESAVSSGTRIACPPGPRPAKAHGDAPARYEVTTTSRWPDTPSQEPGTRAHPRVSAPARGRTIPGPTTPTSHTWPLSIQVSDDVTSVLEWAGETLIGSSSGSTTPPWTGWARADEMTQGPLDRSLDGPAAAERIPAVARWPHRAFSANELKPLGGSYRSLGLMNDKVPLFTSSPGRSPSRRVP